MIIRKMTTSRPAGDPEAAATRQEARGAPPVGARLVTHLRIQARRSASAERPSQAAHPARRGSDARGYPDASGPPVPADVAESVSGLAPPADRVCTRRSVVLPSDVTTSTDARRGPGDRGHGHFARVPLRPDRHARRARAAARHGDSVALDLVPVLRTNSVRQKRARLVVPRTDPSLKVPVEQYKLNRSGRARIETCV